jgi:hypothetical protein
MAELTSFVSTVLKQLVPGKPQPHVSPLKTIEFLLQLVEMVMENDKSIYDTVQDMLRDFDGIKCEHKYLYQRKQKNQVYQTRNSVTAYPSKGIYLTVYKIMKFNGGY